MFKLYAWPDAEVLVRELAYEIDASRVDVFEDVHVLTPNQTLGGFLELGLARHSRSQIAANVTFSRLESYLTKLLEKADERLRVLNSDMLQSLVLSVLNDRDFLESPEARDPRMYVEPAELDGLDIARETRAFQLSSKVAGLFTDYAWSRPDLLEAWTKGRLLYDDETERWQRAIWRRIFDHEQAIEAHSKRYVFLFNGLALLSDDALRKVLPKRLYFFGFPHLSASYHAFLERLKRLSDVHYFCLLPDPESGSDDKAHHYWGPKVAVTMTALHKLADTMAPFEGSPPIESDSLSALQALIRGEEFYASSLAPEGVVLAKTTGIKREVEVVANAIWTRLSKDQSLFLSDFAVVIAGQKSAEYLAQIETVFRSFHDLRFSVAGRRTHEQSRIFGAIQALFELPLGEFSRSQVLGCLLHPNIQIQCPDANAEAWLTWCEKTGIFHGHSHEAHAGTYIQKDIYNWDQGLRRLALGSFLRASTDELFEADRGDYLPEEVDQSGLGAASSFNLFARSLINDALWLSEKKLSLKEWSQLLLEFVEIYVGADRADMDTYQSERGELTLVGMVLARLGEQDVNESKIGYRSATLMALAALERVQTRAGRLALDAVCVAEPSTIQGNSFKHIFVLGLGEGEFPSSFLPEPLDLREREPKPHDVTPNLRDRLAFLHLILAARKSLTLSWVSKDATTGDELEPASVVSELEHIMRTNRFDVVVEDHPLRRFNVECGYFSGNKSLGQNHHPEAYREAVLARLHADLHAHFVSKAQVMPPVWQLTRALGDGEISSLFWLNRKIGLHTSRAQIAHEEPRRKVKRVRVSLSRIKAFLLSPLQGIAKHHLGFIDDDDTVLQDRESFGNAVWGYTVLMRDFFIQEMVAGRVGQGGVARRFADVMDFKAEVRGELPTGVFRDMDLPRIQSVLEGWESGVGPMQPPVIYSINEEVSDGQTRIEFPPIPLQKDLEIEIFGVLPPLDGARFLQFATASNSKIKYAMDAYVAHVILSAIPEFCGTHRTAFVQLAEKNQTYQFTPLSSSEAMEILLNILHDLVEPEEGYMMPLEVVEKWADQKRNPKPFSKLLEDDKNDIYSRNAYTYGPIKDYRPYGPPSDLHGRAQRYFAALNHLNEALSRRQGDQ